MMDFTTIGLNAIDAKYELASSSVILRNRALDEIAIGLEKNKRIIIEQNRIDVKNAEANGMKSSLVDRLYLNEARISQIAQDIWTVKYAGDPLGIIEGGSVRPNGMRISKVRVPLGVVGIIYEARPNVTVDSAALCIKSGNAVILRGGSDAIYTNTVIVEIIREAIAKAGLPKDCVQLVTDTSRESSMELMKANEYIDVLIPRGGAGLIGTVVKNATVPVIQTGTGNCHIYVDDSASVDMAVDIIENAKTQRYGVCNACESLLVHKNIAEDVLPKLKKRLDKHSVEIRGCHLTQMILGDCVVPATDEDYYTEYLDAIISCKIVDSVYEAIDHINRHSTGHSEAIITENLSAAELFKQRIDSAAVYVNASTRFTDGGQFGLGAEIGISTQKLHARGPMGLKELTTYKYIIDGSGQIRE